MNRKEITLERVIIKRDGSKAVFDRQKISRAITAAFREAHPNWTDTERESQVEQVTDEVMNSLPRKTMHVYEVQALIEQVLLKRGFDTVAEAYMHYRMTRDVERTRLAKAVNAVRDKDTTVVNENANKDSRLYNTQRDLTAGAVAKSLGLELLPEEVREAHLNGDIHWHK